MKTLRPITMAFVLAAMMLGLFAGGSQVAAQGATVEEPENCLIAGEAATSLHKVTTPSGKVILVCHLHPGAGGPAGGGGADVSEPGCTISGATTTSSHRVEAPNGNKTLVCRGEAT